MLILEIVLVMGEKKSGDAGSRLWGPGGQRAGFRDAECKSEPTGLFSPTIPLATDPFSSWRKVCAWSFSANRRRSVNSHWPQELAQGEMLGNLVLGIQANFTSRTIIYWSLFQSKRYVLNYHVSLIYYVIIHKHFHWFHNSLLWGAEKLIIGHIPFSEI